MYLLKDEPVPPNLWDSLEKTRDITQGLNDAGEPEMDSDNTDDEELKSYGVYPFGTADEAESDDSYIIDDNRSGDN